MNDLKIKRLFKKNIYLWKNHISSYPFLYFVNAFGKTFTFRLEGHHGNYSLFYFIWTKQLWHFKT